MHEALETAPGVRRRRLLFQVVPLATMAGAAAAVGVTIAIYVGSTHLEHFDTSLIGYATATVFLAFGASYRLVLWAANPPSGRYLRKGWGALLRPGTLARAPGLAGQSLVGGLLLQRFIRPRGLGRWLAHQAMFWGVVLAAAMTFPLTFGWIHFRASGTARGYVLYVLGARVLGFDAHSPFGWLLFHGLDVAAVLVIAGSGAYLLRRLSDRQVRAMQRPVRDLLPLLALLGISLTGLALTASTALLHGRLYHPLAVLHMATVVLTLLFVPFGKFFHVLHRTATAAVPFYKATSRAEGGLANCRSCGRTLEAAAFVGDLAMTMDELGLRYPGWVETCPACKRIERGRAYQAEVKAGFG